jgi:integrase
VRPAVEITDDDIFFALEALGQEPARIFHGRDADGQPVLRSKGTCKSTATVNRYRDALSAVYNWGIAKRRLPKGFENPCHKVKKHPERLGVVRFLDADERTRLLEACKASSWPRLYALVLLCLTSGARRGEALSLRWRQVDLERRVARVLVTKNGEARTLPLTPAVVQALRPLRELDAVRFKLGLQHQLVFHSDQKPQVAFAIEGPWYAALKAAQVRKFRFHDLRHSCASYLAQEGASLIELADILGHKTMAMVKRYSHLTVQSKASLIDRVLGGIQ